MEELTRGEAELKEAAKEEEERTLAILREAGTSEKKIKALKEIIKNTAWMKVKLDDAREQIRESSVAIPYDNGGGQKGIRENPLFKGYEGLWRSYMAGQKQILEAMPEEEVRQKAEEEKPKTTLDLIREKKSASGKSKVKTS